MNLTSIMALLASLVMNIKLPAQPENPQQETISLQSKAQEVIDEYTTYFKEELVDTYHGLGELGSDFISDVTHATAPVSTVIGTGVKELGILARDGYRTLKLELRPIRNLIITGQKKLEELRSNITVENK